MHTVGQIIGLGTAALQLAAAVLGARAAWRARRRRREAADAFDDSDG